MTLPSAVPINLIQQMPGVPLVNPVDNVTGYVARFNFRSEAALSTGWQAHDRRSARPDMHVLHTF